MNAFLLRVFAATLVVAALGTSPGSAQSTPAQSTPAKAAPAPDPAAELFRDNVVIVLDASGSMNEPMRGSGRRVTRMDAAKQALLAVIGHVPDNTQVGLVVFSASNLRNDWTYDLQPANRSELAKAIQMPRPGGGTPLGQYLKIGADRLLKQRDAQQGYGTFRLLVVTDGIASDPILVDRYLPDILARGIVVDVIGVDMQEDHPLATRVRSYRRANDPESLEKAVTSAISEVGPQGPQDTTSQEQFDLVAAFPPEMASAALEALTNSGNHPIGERPRVRPLPEHHEDTHDLHTGVPHKTTSRMFNLLGLTCFSGLLIVGFFVFLLKALVRGSR